MGPEPATNEILTSARPPPGAARSRGGSGRRVAQRRNDLATVDFELLLLVAVHEVDVELVDAGVGELPQLGDLLVGRPEHAEAVGHLVADERGVARTDLGVMVIVVPGTVRDVAGQR